MFEPPLAVASELERADFIQAAAGVAAGFLGLPGAPAIEGAPASAEYQAIVMPAGPAAVREPGDGADREVTAPSHLRGAALWRSGSLVWDVRRRCLLVASTKRRWSRLSRARDQPT